MTWGWQPSAGVVARRLDDEVVLVNLHTNRIFSLNRTGARVWELLAAGRDWEEIRSALLEEFDVEADQVDRELEELMASLADERFVEPSGLRGERHTSTGGATQEHRRLPRAARRATTASLLVRMGAWSLVLPALKHVLPLPRLVRLMARPGGGVRSPDAEWQIVRNAGRVYRLRPTGNCLERSLVVYRYLSRASAEPRLLVGVRREDGDVRGHAWVLVDDAPLYESSTSLERFLPVVEFGADGSATELVDEAPAALDNVVRG